MQWAVPRTALCQIAITLVLLSGGFNLFGTIGYMMSPVWLSAEEIRAKAEKAIEEPEYPVAPVGRTIMETIARQVCIDVPNFSGLRIRMTQSCSDIPEQFPMSDDDFDALKDAVRAMNLPDVVLH